MHEYSDDPDVVARLAAETAWAIKVRRRYVELRPGDAESLLARVEQLEQRVGSHPRVRELSMQVRITELSTALTDAIEALSWASDYTAVDWPPPYRIENFRAVLAPKENAVALEADPEAPSRVVGEHDPRCASLTAYGRSQRWCDCATLARIDESL